METAPTRNSYRKSLQIVTILWLNLTTDAFVQST